MIVINETESLEDNINFLNNFLINKKDDITNFMKIILKIGFSFINKVNNEEDKENLLLIYDTLIKIINKFEK